jgi:NADPH-dependent 2,4-dienoyl-CoA reductase/sulfur reductase-like enzyme
MDQGSDGVAKIGRRRFLKAALSTAAVLSTGRSLAQTRSLPPQNGETILVVGAGLSGLVAAYRLREAGKRVIVIEARGVPGGAYGRFAISMAVSTASLAQPVSPTRTIMPSTG